ncbi:DALR anticodon-binding domain-containing protein 3-like [Diadema antillarum]|uniref:DALR anticodon-binding domain-containing protein 3-like n=1 Tax=Diadema antillarum TaxID=105358 RepID=UPI003A8896BE
MEPGRIRDRVDPHPHQGAFAGLALKLSTISSRLKVGVDAVTAAILSEGQSLPVPVVSCSPCENGFISIRLHRPTAFRRVIQDITVKGGQYGHHAGVKERTVLVNAPPALKTDKESLAALRQNLVAQHVSALLEASGYDVHQVHHCFTSQLTCICKLLGEDQHPASSASDKVLSSESERLHPKIVRGLTQSRHVAPADCVDGGENTDAIPVGTCGSTTSSCHGDGTEQSGPGDDKLRLPSQLSLNLLDVLGDFDIQTRKGGYSQNLTKVQLTSRSGEASHLLQECSRVQYALDQLSSQGLSKGCYILHIVPSSCEFTQQQSDLALRALSTDFSSCQQFHLSCAPVSISQQNGPKPAVEGAVPGGVRNTMDADALYSIRESQMRAASVMKYGDQVQGDTWDAMIETLTAAGIKFDILGTHVRHLVKVDLGDSKSNNPWPDNRNGVFVVYNYARLSRLFSCFEEEVSKGTYPPLPPLETIDFSTLKEDAEWKLLLTHLLTFPDVVSDTIGNGFTTQNLYCKFETQKVCRFLVTLSQDLSAYYSRFRILVEPRPHLLPCMFARLYLLKAVHIVLGNGLSLLRIRPLTQM